MHIHWLMLVLMSCFIQCHEATSHNGDPTSVLLETVETLKNETRQLKERIGQLEKKERRDSMIEQLSQHVESLSAQLQTCTANYSGNVYNYGQCLKEKAELVNPVADTQIQLKRMTLDLHRCNQNYEACKVDNSTCNNQLYHCQGSEVKLHLQLSTCNAAKAAYPKTCDDWKKQGYTTSGYYVIDPDGPGGLHQFQVECDMTSSEGGRTIIHHDSESRIQVRPRCGGPRCYRRNIQYVISMQQIKAVMNITKNCIQFVKYDCLYTIHLSGNHGAWLAYDGQIQSYWGGATPGSGKCACGMTNSCDKPGKVCNCDANDNVWRSDAGVLNDKNTLPVSGVLFGDMDGDEEDAYHRVGPLQCFN